MKSLIEDDKLFIENGPTNIIAKRLWGKTLGGDFGMRLWEETLGGDFGGRLSAGDFGRRR